MQDPHFKLNEEESAPYKSAPISPVFKIMVGDCRILVVETLMANLHLQTWDLKVEGQRDWIRKLQQFIRDQAKKCAIDVAVIAAENMRQLGGEGLDFETVTFEYKQESSQRLQSLFA